MPLKSLHAVEVFENNVYLAPWSDTVIVAMDKFSLTAKQIIKDVKRPFDFRIFHRQKQPEGKLCPTLMFFTVCRYEYTCMYEFMNILDLLHIKS